MNRDVLNGDPETPLSEVLAQMNDLGESEFVVCEGNCPVGIITERDAVSLLHQCLTGSDYHDLRAGDVMRSPAKTLREESQMGEVVRVMNEFRFRRVPITNAKDELTGIVNLLDLQFAMNTALQRRGQDLEVAVMERTAELMKANEKLEELSIRDGLTGLLNRRAMAERLDALHAMTRRYGNAYSVILTDIDHFKKYNDQLGHVQGDEGLRAVSKILSDAVRTSDSVYRYGGEEFLVAMPETGQESASVVAERIRASVENAALPHPESTTGPFLTLSLGHAVVTRDTIERFPTWQEVVETADRALYRAKQSGRNCVVGSNEID